MGRVEVDTGCVDVCFSSLGQVCRRFLISVSDVYPYPHVILFLEILLDRSHPRRLHVQGTNKQVDLSFQ